MEKRLVPFLLLLIIVFSSITAYGERIFTDVAENHWAYDYILKVVDLGLMDGYNDATFRPNEAVNIDDALIYIMRISNAYREAIDEELIKSEFSKEGKIRKATKLEVTKYLAIAMGFDEEDQQASQIFLYNDISEIPVEDRPYVKFLIDEGILDKRGDGNGNFNPNQEVNRAILAKMLSQAYDAMSGKSIIEVEKIIRPEESHEDEDVSLVEERRYEEVSGSISLIIEEYLIIDVGEKLAIYRIGDSTQVILDGKDVDIEELKEEMDVKLWVSEDRAIERIEAGSGNLVHGTIKEIFIGEDPYIVVEGDNDSTYTFNLTQDTKVVLDGEDAYLFNLDEGDRIKVEISEDIALYITGESKEGIVLGTVRGKIVDEGKYLLVERDNGSIYEYEIKPGALIYRDFNGVRIEDLRASDEVILVIREGQVDRIDAYSTPGQDRGYIRSILISDKPVLTIEREDGTIVSYYLSNKAMMVKDKSILSIYDLRLGDIVDLDLKSDEIVHLNIDIKTEE